MAFRNRSKFFNVQSTPEKNPDLCWPDLRPSHHDTAHVVAASATHCALVVANREGASVGVLDLARPGKREQEVALVHPHAQQILDISFLPYTDDLFGTCSMDGTIAVTHIPDAEGSCLDVRARLVGHEGAVTALRFNPAAQHVTASTGADATLRMWDLSAEKELSSLAVGSALSDISWSQMGGLLFGANKDRKVVLCDPRASAVAATADGHHGTKPMKVTWLGDSDRALTTGFSKMRVREVMVWDTKNMAKPLTTVSFECAPGVITPHYDPDSKLAFLVGRGDATVRVMDLSPAKAPFQAELPTGKVVSTDSQQDACLLPKRALNVMGCEVARMLRLLDNKIVSVGFHVPRRVMDAFQDDLFPDTAGAHSMTVAEWSAGAARLPATRSLRP